MGWRMNLKKVSAATRAAVQLMKKAGESVQMALLVVGTATMFAVFFTANAKFYEPSAGGGVRDPEWWLLAAASAVSMAALWMVVAIAIQADPQAPARHRTLGQVILALTFTALLATIAVSELDLEVMLEVTETMLEVRLLPNQQPARRD